MEHGTRKFISSIMKLRQPEHGRWNEKFSERASSDPDQPRARASSIRHQHHFRIISTRDGLRLIASKFSRCQQHAGMPASLARDAGMPACCWHLENFDAISRSPSRVEMIRK